MNENNEKEYNPEEEIGKDKKSGRRIDAAGLVILAVCFGLGFCAPPVFDSALLRGESTLDIALTVLILISAAVIAFFLELMIHEAGHLVFGLMSGYRFQSFRVGNVMWMKKKGENGEEKIIRKRFSLSGTLGQCLLSPPELKDGEFPYKLYNYGGVLMNFISAAVCALLYALLQNVIFLSTLLIFMALLGALFGVTNGIPYSNRMVANDGTNVRTMNRSREARLSFWKQLKISELTSNELELRDMPEELFEAEGGSTKDPLTATIHVMRENRLMNEEKFEEAGALARRLCGNPAVPGIYAALLTCDLIYIDAVSGRRESAESYLTDAQKKLIKKLEALPTALRTEYVISKLGVKDAGTDAQVMEKFERMARNYPYPSDIRMERRLIEIAQERLDSERTKE